MCGHSLISSRSTLYDMNHSKGNFYKGFSLLELLVSISIMVTMSTILLWNYPDSSIRIRMANITQTVALVLREAQIRGSAIDSNNGTYAGYGIYFNRASSTSIVLFGDIVIPSNYVNGILIGDGLYNSSPVDEVKTITKLPLNYSVSKLCVSSSSGIFYCNATTSPEIDTLTISFIRPNTQPLIYVNDSTSSILSLVSSAVAIPTPYTGACIEISSPHAPNPGHVRSIRIEGAGFITTKVSGCE